MKEAQLDWATYYLDLCTCVDEAETAYRRWMEKADCIPGAEVRVVRFPMRDGLELYYVVTQSRKLVPPPVLRWHEEVAAGMDAEQAAWRLLGRTGYGYTWPGDPSPLAVLDLTSRTPYEKGVLTEEAWGVFCQTKLQRKHTS